MKKTALALLILSASANLMAQDLTNAEKMHVDNQIQQLTRVNHGSAVICIAN